MKRFLNADSYGSTGQGFTGFNMFAYCGNNPVRRSDPSGHSWIEDFITKIENMVKTAVEEAKERKKRFQKSFEATYGVSFDNKCSSAHYSVSVETHYPNALEEIGRKTIKTTGNLCSVAGVGLLTLPECTITKVGGTVCTAVGGICTVINWFDTPDEEYQMYVVDIWDVNEWVQLTNGKTIGHAVGEKHQFRIYNDKNGGEILEYLGAVDFTYYTGVTPGESPCYQYYFHVDENWCRIP